MPSIHPMDSSPEPLIRTMEFTLSPTDLSDYMTAKKIPENLVQQLQTNEQTGLATPIAPERTLKYGENRLPATAVKSIIQLMFEAYHDKTLIGLTIAALISLAVGIWEDTQESDPTQKIHWVEGVAIIVAVIIVITVASVNDYKKELQFRELNKKKESRNIQVTRDGIKQNVSVYDLQVGDLLHTEPGDIIPVDAVLVECSNLKCDESGATGESDLIKKSLDKDRFLISGARVSEGTGTAIVIAVGVHSFNGRTMMALRTPPSDTPLEIKLDGLAELIAKAGLAISLLLLLVLLIKYCAVNGSQHTWGSSSQVVQEIVEIFIVCITLLVVAVPEGLPLAVTLALAYATTRMLRENNLVRLLSACETMGNATCVCSDKTGTLTQNKMTVVSGVLFDKVRFTNAQATIPELAAPDCQARMQDLKQSICINTTAFEDLSAIATKKTYIGSKTECALLEFATKMPGEFHYLALRKEHELVQAFPFSSERKSMCTVVIVKRPGSEPIYRAHLKGASEIILEMCNSYCQADGSTAPLSTEFRTSISKDINDYANQSLRTICLAVRDFSASEWNAFAANDVNLAPSDKFSLLALVGIEDPLRPGVTEAVQKCQKAGVFIRMVTGDNLQTAKAIATKCGILMTGGIAMEGSRFRSLPESEMDTIIPRLQVLARSSPTDKQLLVQRLRHLGEVVAVTGDGTNDGPALKAADVGFSMGIAGTEVAKEASSIILMDDNFASIVKAISWGRAVNDAVKKFLQFQLTVNVTAVILAFFSACYDSKNASVLTAVQLLWVNLIMDSLGALALATEPPGPEILDRYPEDKRSWVINGSMAKMILGQSIYQLIVTIILLILGGSIFGLNTDVPSEKLQLTTLIFNTFVMMQIFNQLNCRRIDNNLNIFQNIFANPIFCTIWISVLGLQALIVEFGGNVFKTTSQSGNYWAVAIIIGLLTLPIGAALRKLPISDKWCIPRDVRDHGRIMMTRERLQWLSAVGQVRTSLSVLKTLRGARSNTSGNLAASASARSLQQAGSQEQLRAIPLHSVSDTSVHAHASVPLLDNLASRGSHGGSGNDWSIAPKV